MITSPYKLESWPTNNQFKRPSPGLAEIGRSWIDIRIESIPALVGDIFNDVPIEYPIIGAAVDYTLDDNGNNICSFTLIDFLKKLVPLHSIEWRDMKYFTWVFLQVNGDKHVIPTQYIEYDRSGMYWELPFSRRVE